MIASNSADHCSSGWFPLGKAKQYFFQSFQYFFNRFTEINNKIQVYDTYANFKSSKHLPISFGKEDDVFVKLTGIRWDLNSPNGVVILVLCWLPFEKGTWT